MKKVIFSLIAVGVSGNLFGTIVLRNNSDNNSVPVLRNVSTSSENKKGSPVSSSVLLLNNTFGLNHHNITVSQNHKTNGINNSQECNQNQNKPLVSDQEITGFF